MGNDTNDDVVNKYIREPMKRAIDAFEKEEQTQWFFKKTGRGPLTSEEKEAMMNDMERKLMRKTPLTREEIEEEKMVKDLIRRVKETWEAERNR